MFLKSYPSSQAYQLPRYEHTTATTQEDDGDSSTSGRKKSTSKIRRRIRGDEKAGEDEGRQSAAATGAGGMIKEEWESFTVSPGGSRRLLQQQLDSKNSLPEARLNGFLKELEAAKVRVYMTY